MSKNLLNVKGIEQKINFSFSKSVPIIISHGTRYVIYIVLDSAFVDPLPQEGLVGTSHSRPRGDDVLEGSSIADSRSPTADLSWDQWEELLGVTLE